jgi:hypothetical protein
MTKGSATKTQKSPAKSAKMPGPKDSFGSSATSCTEGDTTTETDSRLSGNDAEMEDDIEEFDDEEKTGSEEDEISEETVSESGTATGSSEEWKPKKKSAHFAPTKNATSKSPRRILTEAPPPIFEEDVRAAKAGKTRLTQNSTKKVSEVTGQLEQLVLSNEQAAGPSKRATRSSTTGKALKAKQTANGAEEWDSDADDSAIIVPKKAANTGLSKGGADASKKKKR